MTVNEMELVGRFGEVDPLSPEAFENAKVALHAAMAVTLAPEFESEPQSARVGRHARRSGSTYGAGRHARSRRPLMVASLVAAAAVAVTLVTVPGGHSSNASAGTVTPTALSFTQGAPGSGVAILDTAATQILQAPAPATSLPVHYYQTTGWALGLVLGNSGQPSTPYIETDVRQVWQNSDGSDNVKDFRQDTTSLGADVGGPQPASDPTNVSGHYAPGTYSYSLPTSLPALRAALTPQGGSGPTDPSIPTQAAADAVGGLNPQEIASLYELIAETPGVFDAGQVTDNDGRTGVAIGFNGTPVGSPTGYSVTEYLVLNPSNGQPLEYEEIASPASVLAPSLGSQSIVTQYMTLDTSTYVATSGQV